MTSCSLTVTAFALGIENVDKRLTCPVTGLYVILAHQLPQQSGHLRSALPPLNCASTAGIPMSFSRHDLLRMCYSTLAFLSTWCEWDLHNWGLAIDASRSGLLFLFGRSNYQDYLAVSYQTVTLPHVGEMCYRKSCSFQGGWFLFRLIQNAAARVPCRCASKTIEVLKCLSCIFLLSYL
jgi:hypothetical protein